jgi:hypothetical protein
MHSARKRYQSTFRYRAVGLPPFFQLLPLTYTVALSFNQYVNPIALAVRSSFSPPSSTQADPQAIAWKYYFVFSGIQIFLIVFAWFFFLETRGCTIEEASLLYDGPEAVARASEKAAQDTHDMPAKKDDVEQEFVEGGDVKRTA